MTKRVIVEYPIDSEEEEKRIIVDKRQEEEEEKMIIEKQGEEEKFYYFTENEKIFIELITMKTESSTCESKDCYLCYLYTHLDDKK